MTPYGWTQTVALGLDSHVTSFQFPDFSVQVWGVVVLCILANRACWLAIGWPVIRNLMDVHLIQKFIALHCRVESYPEPAESGSCSPQYSCNINVILYSLYEDVSHMICFLQFSKLKFCVHLWCRPCDEPVLFLQSPRH